ncbi:hypothetical protein [Alienimonas chondri]|uniref:Uncharacterized protein n=1 Tax=Alienimonas chondri TaxID=2681879 RepID=A0ABX1VK66_9PLAN|nr:hypothetical protein [Alienimonas chondri]NNJ27830.1 hypothetical protein [Alienimonas chondri]
MTAETPKSTIAQKVTAACLVLICVAVPGLIAWEYGTERYWESTEKQRADDYVDVIYEERGGAEGWASRVVWLGESDAEQDAENERLAAERAAAEPNPYSLFR